jgi:hypothetical protein
MIIFLLGLMIFNVQACFGALGDLSSLFGGDNDILKIKRDIQIDNEQENQLNADQLTMNEDDYENEIEDIN